MTNLLSLYSNIERFVDPNFVATDTDILYAKESPMEYRYNNESYLYYSQELYDKISAGNPFQLLSVDMIAYICRHLSIQDMVALFSTNKDIHECRLINESFLTM
jgi:hypothetical protein